MPTNIGVPLFDLALILANAIDLISPILHNHHKQVAYISYCLAKELKFEGCNYNNLLVAGLTHDIGGLTLDDRESALHFDIINPHKHAKIGYLLLKNSAAFSDVANIINYHHLSWDDGQGREVDGRRVPFESHIIHLADRIAIAIDNDREILGQVNDISSIIEKRNIKMFHPDLVDIFHTIKSKESFWLDIVSLDLNFKINKLREDCGTFLNLDELLDAAKIIANIIDFRSRFTAVHSSGVATVAEILARKANWDESKCKKIKIAGYLHDLGKLAIPNTILDKSGRLSDKEYNIMKAHTYYGFHIMDQVEALNEINEYASFHHERLDGRGYPFQHDAETLKDGSKLMAVADIFTAITEDRPYRKGMEKEKVLRIMGQMVNHNKLESSFTSLLFDNYDEINELRFFAQKYALEEYKQFSTTINSIR